MRKMKISSWFLTDKGRRRDSNQDSCLVNEGMGLYVVADGMGGHSGGEVASQMAVQIAEEITGQALIQKLHPRETIGRIYLEASQRIYDRSRNENPELAGMGTTLVVSLLRGKNLYIGNVGDSRCYLFQKPYLWQLTEDHSMLNEQLRAGLITEEQSKKMAGKNVITRSVGYEREVVPDIIEKKLEVGEVYLLCSDGLTGMVSNEDISNIIETKRPEDIAQCCIDLALKNGGDDNVTVLVLYVEDDGKGH